jgi:hypothetical protein
MKHLFILFNLLLIWGCIGRSQKIGYELRTNGKSYLTISHKIHDKGGLELRHKTDLGENRFTYRHNFKVADKVVFSVPLHYKREKNEPTWEPRLIYKFDKFKLWAQQEFWFDEIYNLAIATDIPYKNYVYRVGWDTSNTIRFRISIKI